MKIITYNMQHDKKSKHNWSAILAGEDPDVLLAQESLAPDRYDLSMSDDGWAGRTTWSLVVAGWSTAVYLKSGAPRQLDLPSFGGWVVGVEVPDSARPEFQSKRLRVFSVHAPTAQGSYPRVVNSILDMLLEMRDGCDLVIGGDFNLTVSQRHETEDRVTTKAERAIQERLRDEFGLINCWQTANPDRPLAQTLRWDRDPKPAYHCDGIFVPKEWAQRMKSGGVLAGNEWDGLSDHNRVVAEFE